MFTDIVAASLLIPNTFRGVLSAKLFDQRLSFARDLVRELHAKNNKLKSEKKTLTILCHEIKVFHL